MCCEAVFWIVHLLLEGKESVCKRTYDVLFVLLFFMTCIPVLYFFNIPVFKSLFIVVLQGPYFLVTVFSGRKQDKGRIYYLSLANRNLIF